MVWRMDPKKGQRWKQNLGQEPGEMMATLQQDCRERERERFRTPFEDKADRTW